MSVAYFVTEYPGGSHTSTFIRREIAALRDRGVEIEVCAIRRPPRDSLLAEREVQDWNETWSVLPVRPAELLRSHVQMALRSPQRYSRTLALALRHRNRGARNLLWACFHFAEAVHLAVELGRRDVDHLHVQFATSGAQIGMLVHALTDLPWSIALHGSCDFEYPAAPLLGDKLETVEFASCASHFGRAQAMRTIPPKLWDRLFVSRCGIELDQLPAREAREGDLPEFHIYSVGRLSPEKGASGLITALQKVRAAGLDAHLTVVGEGPTRPELDAWVASLGLGDHCHLLGALAEEDTLKQIARADVVALSSFMEGLPVVLMEAMGLGVPVVAPRLAGIPELVDHERNGLLFHPGDWDGLADAILRLANDPDLGRRLASAARETVQQGFDITGTVEPLVERFGAAADPQP